MYHNLLVKYMIHYHPLRFHYSYMLLGLYNHPKKVQNTIHHLLLLMGHTLHIKDQYIQILHLHHIHHLHPHHYLLQHLFHLSHLNMYHNLLVKYMIHYHQLRFHYSYMLLHLDSLLLHLHHKYHHHLHHY